MGALTGGFAFAASLLVQGGTLVAIPFAFKIAGGLVGRVFEFTQGARKQLQEKGPLAGRRQRESQLMKDRALMSQERTYDRLNSGGRASQFLARQYGGNNLKARVSEMNARTGKVMQDQNNTGDDTELRAYSVNKNMLNSAWRAQHGVEGTDWKNVMDKDGNVTGQQYRTLGGAWVDEGAVRAAYSRYGEQNMSAQQWSLEHEMDKASTQEEQDYLANNFGKVAGGPDASWQMSGGQRAGMFKGAAFSKQNVNRQWKHYGIGEDGHLKMGTKNALSLFREIDEKQGNYAMMQQNADTWTTMSQSMVEASATVATPRTYTAPLSSYADPAVRAKAEAEQVQHAQAQEILERGARIAAATRSSSMAATPIPSGSGGAPTPPPVSGAMSGREVGAGAAGRVQDEMIRFVGTADATAGPHQAPAAGTVLPPRPREPQDASLARRRADTSGPVSGPGTPNPTGTGGAGTRRS